MNHRYGDKLYNIENSFVNKTSKLNHMLVKPNSKTHVLHNAQKK